MLTWISLSLNNCFRPLGLKTHLKKKKSRIYIALFFLTKAESICIYLILWSEAFQLQNVEACNFLFQLKSRRFISGVSVDPAVLWYLEGPLEIWWFHLKAKVVSSRGLLWKARRTMTHGSQHHCTHSCAYLFAVMKQGWVYTSSFH